jgi:hypothetical protein
MIIQKPESRVSTKKWASSVDDALRKIIKALVFIDLSLGRDW